MRSSDQDRRITLDLRDAELQRLKRERDESIARERRARAEAEELKERLASLTSASKNFASSIRDRTGERRRSRQRLGVQYTVGRVLAEAENLQEAAPGLLKSLGEGFGWDVGVLWAIDKEAGVLRCEALWRSPKARPPGGFEDECRRSSFRRGVGLPGHVWAVGQAVWSEDLLEAWGLVLDKAAAAAGLRGALAFPIQDANIYGIVELLRLEVSPLDEELRQTATLVGYQIGQFVERRRVEEERELLLARLAREQAHLEAVIQQMPAGLFLANASGKVIKTNDEAGRIYRRPYDPAESLDEYARWECFYPDGRKLPPERYPLVRSLLRGEVVEAEEYKIRRADGEEGFVNANSAPIRDARGEIVAGVVSFNDVTAHKRAEEALRKGEKRYKALYEDNPFMYFTTDTRGMVLSVNRSGAKQLGYTVEELVGHPMLDIFHEEDKEGVSRYFSACLQNSERSDAWEARKVRKDGSALWVKENVRIVQSPGGDTIVLLLCEDITERKRAAEERERLRARESATRAEAAERRRISRELHDRVAHSMGVVHQSLQLYKVLLSRDPSQAEAKLTLAQEMARTALDSTRNLAMELRNSITEGNLESALSSLLRNSVPPDVESELSVEGEESFVPPHVRDQLFLVLREAVRNAVSHSGCGRVSLHLDVAPERITSLVEDDGRGFDPEGTANGGGLESMKERAALVGGACSVLSEPNGGTRVQVSVPLDREG